MKKIVKSFILVAAAAMGFTACQKEIQEEVPVNEGTVQVTFVSGSPETKTSVDTSGEDKPVFSWDENETFAVLEQQNSSTPTKAGSVEYEKVDGKAKITATFGAGSYVKGATMYQYVTIYPASGYVGAESLAAATLSLPAEQTMATGSYDPAADLMVSTILKTPEPPTEAQMVSFTRMAAVVKMTLKNFTLESGDEVEQVIFTAEGKTLAGTITADLAEPNGFASAEGVDNVTVNTTSSTDVYFTVLPTTLEAGDAYTVAVITDKKLYIKKGVIPEGNTLEFKKGMVTLLGVNMAGVAPSEKWVLVRDASTLEAGDIVTVAASDFNYVMGKLGSSYAYASYTEVVKMCDYLYHPVTPAGTTSGDNVLHQFVLVNSDKDDAFHFYSGVDFTGDAYIGYVCIPASNYNLKVQDYPDYKSLFYIEIDSKDGVASVVASDSGVTYNALKYRANSGGTSTSNRRFGCVNSSATYVYDVCLYKIAGAKGVVPTAGAVVTVPGSDKKVAIAKEGVAESTVFEDVEFTYVGDWTIEAETDAEWLTVDYADGVLSYTADANDGAVRYAVVTVTASLEGEESKTWSFNVVQKGAPVKVTVAEFIEKAVDPNVEYEVTGLLQSKGSGASYSTTVVDAAGNKATFKYIDMADGSDFYKNADVAVNNIVTIVASVATKGTGGSSTAHALCKGYYNLEAMVENDLVAYTGGSVEIALNKLGTLDPAGNITAKADVDFAELKYTANSDKATVTLPANDGAPRQVVVTFTDGYATTSVAVVQGADTAKGNTWELVTDASTLEAGDQVIIAAKDYDVAMSTTISSERRSAVAAAKLGNYFLTPTADVQTLVLANGSAEGTFAFYDATNKGFLVSTSTSYELNNQTYIDANTSFTVSIADGVATIGNKTGDYSSNKMYYREGSSYNYFYSGTTAKQAVCLYRLVGVKGTIPVTPADVTVPTAKVVIPEEGAAVATPINDVKFNYVGEWNISATSEADWITFAFDKANSKLTYTAAANEGIVRETSATITATMEGQEPLIWNFNVLQKGAPMEVSIAEFINKEINVNVTYKLTGKIVTIPSSATDYFVIADADGIQAKVRYLKTEDGKDVKGNIDLKQGDVITVTTIVTTAKGSGGSSTYPSYFKGYYRLTATASSALVGHEGGPVTISLETSGNLQPTDAVIKGAMADAYDFVTFDYTEGASTATATFAANAGAPRNAEFNFTFGLAPASVTIGQQNNPDVKVGWYRVESADDLKAGDKVIISGKSLDGTLDYSIKTWTNTSTSTTMPITVVGNYIPDVTDIQQFTLANGSDEYPGTFAIVRTDNRYLSNSSGSLKTGTSINEYSSWSIAIDSANNGAVTLKCAKAYSSKDTIALNLGTSSQSFGIYKPADAVSRGAIYIYKYYNNQQ